MKQKNKFGVSIILYDGEELLDACLKAIRPYVDYINIVYSLTSYTGKPGNAQLPNLLKKYQKMYQIDEITEYNNAPNLSKHQQELRKRQAGLNMAKKANVNYFMFLDSDEFYDGFAIQNAKQIILDKKITHSYVHILNYGTSPIKRYDKRKWEYYVPFFSKINKYTKCGNNKRAPCLADPTRQMLSFGIKEKHYVLENIFMHHMTRVRKNVLSKYESRNVNPNIDSDWINDEKGFITVPNYFDIVV